MEYSTQKARIDYLYALADSLDNLHGESNLHESISHELQYEIVLDKLHRLLSDITISVEQAGKGCLSINTTYDIIPQSERNEKLNQLMDCLQALNWRYPGVKASHTSDYIAVEFLTDGVMEEWFGPLLQKNSPEAHNASYTPRACEQAYEHVE